MRLLIRISGIVSLFLTYNLSFAQPVSDGLLFEEEFLNSFFKACYIDTTNAHIDNPTAIKLSYICNGYGGHWQIFGVDLHGTIILKFDEITRPQTNGIIIQGYNNSGLTCYAIIDWDYKDGNIYKPLHGINKNAFNRKFFPINNEVYIPPFPIKKSILEFAQVDDTCEFDKISFSKPVINPDNILYISKQVASAKKIGESLGKVCLNPETNFGYYVKQCWRDLYSSKKDKYDYSSLDKYFNECIEHNTRITLRIDQTEGDWDLFNIEKPSNWNKYEKAYRTFLDKYHTWFFDEDNNLYIDSLIVTGSYPSKLFFDQIKEGHPPLIRKRYNVYRKDTCYTSYFNYNADCVYREWVKMQTGFYNYINKKKSVNKSGQRVKYKYLIENLYAAVGVTGEGFIDDFGVFPDESVDYIRYFDAFASIFKDVPISFPLAVTYEYQKLSHKEMVSVLNHKNKLSNGRLTYSGLWYDVIGLKGFVPYSYYTNSSFSKMIEAPNERRFCGEGAFNDDSCSQILTHAYLMHLSGVSQHNIPFYKTIESRRQQQKYITLAGAKLHISEVSYDNKKVSIGIQNIGYCRVFSPYWEPYLLFRDANGKLMKKVKISLDLFDVIPNSYDYNGVGVYGKPLIRTETPISIPNKTKTISFAIIDRFGVYENYWLHNTNRVSFSGDNSLKDGEYIIIEL